MSDTSNTNAENNSTQIGVTIPLENPVNGVVTNAPTTPEPTTTVSNATTPVATTSSVVTPTPVSATPMQASTSPIAQTPSQVSNAPAPVAATPTEQTPVSATPAQTSETGMTQETTPNKEESSVASTQPTGSTLGVKPIKTVGESSVSFNSSSEQSTNNPSELADEMKVESVKEEEKKELEQKNDIEKTDEFEKGKFPFVLFGLLGFFVVAFLVYYFILITPYKVFNHMVDSRINNLKSQLNEFTNSDFENIEIDVDTTLNTFDLSTDNKSPIKKVLSGRKDYEINGLKYTGVIDLDIKKQNLGFDLVAYYNEEDKKKGKDAAFIDETLYLVDNKINIGANGTPVKINYNSGNDIDISFERINEAIDALIILKDEALKQVKKELLKRKLVKTTVAGQTALAIKMYCSGDNADLSEIEKGIFSSMLKDDKSIKLYAKVFGITTDEMKHYMEQYMQQGAINNKFNIEILANLAASEVIGVKVELDNIYVNINHLNGIYDIDITTYSGEKDEQGNKIRTFHTDFVFDTYHGKLNGKVSINTDKTRLSFIFDYEKSKNGGDSGNLVNISFYRNVGENLDADIFDEEMEKYGEVRTAKTFADFKWVLSRTQNTKLNVIDRMQKITAPYSITEKYKPSDSNYNEKRSVCLSMFDKDGKVIGIKDKNGNPIEVNARVTENEYSDIVCFFANPEIINLINSDLIKTVKNNPNILKDSSKLKSLNLTKSQMIFINEMIKDEEKTKFLMELINNSDSKELTDYLVHPEIIIEALDMIEVTFEDIIFVVYHLFTNKEFGTFETFEQFYNFTNVLFGSDGPMGLLGDISLEKLLMKVCKDGTCKGTPNNDETKKEEPNEVTKNEISITSANGTTTLDKKDKQLQLTLDKKSVVKGEKFSWTSSDEKIAKVDENGLVTFVSTGEVTIKVKGTIDSSEVSYNLTLTDNSNQETIPKKEEEKKEPKKEEKKEEQLQEVSSDDRIAIEKGAKNKVANSGIFATCSCEELYELAGQGAYETAKELGYNETTCQAARLEAINDAPTKASDLKSLRRSDCVQ